MKNHLGRIYATLMLLALAGCVHSSNLANQVFDGKNITLVYEAPEAPFADFDMTIFDKVGQDLPIMNRDPNGRRSIPSLVVNTIQTGERAPKRDGESQVHYLMDSVLVDYDMSDEIVGATLQRSATVMGLTVLEAPQEGESSDYILEVVVDDYGIGADAWQSTAYFEVMGQVRLINGESGKKIWEGEVMDVVPLSKALLTVGIPAEGKETPAALSEISFDQMKDVLEALASYASIQLTAPLKDAYLRHRSRENTQFESRFVAEGPALIETSPRGQ